MPDPAHVQSRGTTQENQASIALAFLSDNTLGNMLLAVVASDGNPVSVADTQGNVWFRVWPRVTVNTQYQDVFCCVNCKAGANTVTVTLTAGTNDSHLHILEYNNLAQSQEQVVGPANLNSGFGTALTSNSVVITKVPCLLLVTAFNEAINDDAQGTDLTERLETDRGANTPGTMQTQERIVTTAGTYSGDATGSVTTNWAMGVFVFNPPLPRRHKTTDFPKSKLRRST